jgi:hypothetical protein
MLRRKLLLAFLLAIVFFPLNVSPQTRVFGASEVPTADMTYWRKVGTTNYEAWYTSPTTGTALTTGVVTANRLYAIPFVTPKGITVDRIGINVTTLVVGVAMLGIYADNGIYPGSLLLNAGVVSTGATGVQSITISQALSANTLYWLVLVANAAPTLRAFDVGSMVSILGYANTLPTAPNASLYVAFTYGPLPATFPGSATLVTAAGTPAIFVRLSN